MPTAYPTAVDALTNPAAADKLNLPSHSSQHITSNDAIEAIETRLGTGSDTTPGAASRVLRSTSATASEWAKLGLATDTNGSLSLIAQSGLLPLATGTTGSLSIDAVSSLSTFVPWTNYSPTFTGFSSDPTMTAARYMKFLGTVWVYWQGNANGTKNGDSGLITMTVPVASKYKIHFLSLLGYYGAQVYHFTAEIAANGTTLTVGGAPTAGWPGYSGQPENNFGATTTVGWAGCGNLICYEAA